MCTYAMHVNNGYNTQQRLKQLDVYRTSIVLSTRYIYIYRIL